MTEPSEKRFCRQCLTAKPIHEFRLRKRTGTARVRQCRTCHALSELMRRARHKSGRRRLMVANYTLQLKNAKTHREVVLLTNAAIRHFGGLDRFVRAWFEQFDAARRDKPGSKKVLDFFHAVMRLREYCEAIGATERPVSQMSDEELNQSAVDIITGMIPKHPDLVLAAARQLGWTVIPPHRDPP